MLWEVVNNQLIVSEHALMIEPYATIWEFDEDERKSNARQLFKYVELLCSPRKSNPFFGYREDIRVFKVKKEVYKDENHPDTDFMIQAVARYKELLETYSPSYSMLNTAIETANKLETFLREFEPDEKTRTGQLLLKPKDISSALKELPDAKKSIEALRERVNFELAEESRTRKQREIGQYER